MYRIMYRMPGFLKRSDQLFHSSANRLIRIEPFCAQPKSDDQPDSACKPLYVQPLTKDTALKVVTRLNACEREALRDALEFYHSNADSKNGELHTGRWSIQIPNDCNAMPQGQQSNTINHPISYSSVPERSDTIDSSLSPLAMLRNQSEVPPVSREDLLKLMAVNSIPFVGFGFLDNFLMIIAGDYIEQTLGVYMCLSTMAAAALGNTISDVMGLGLAHHVETLCMFMGIRPPKLTPEQIDGKACRRVMSYGRALGITIGCILGMVPLYFMNKKPNNQAEAASSDA